MGLLDEVREAVKVRGYSANTAEQYVYWIRKFVHFHGDRHPMELGVLEVTTFLGSLAVDLAAQAWPGTTTSGTTQGWPSMIHSSCCWPNVRVSA